MKRTIMVFVMGFSVALTARSQSTICANVPQGLLGWWSGEMNAADQLGLNNGDLINGTWYVAGKVGQAFDFDGNNDYIRIPGSPHFDAKDQLTIEFWMKADLDNQVGSRLEGLVAADYYGIEINNLPGMKGVYFFVTTDGGISWPTTADRNGGGVVFNSGEWHHVAGTYDGAKLQLYLDGQPWGLPTPVTGTIPSMLGTSSLTIGSEDGRTAYPFCIGTRYFKGQIDEPAIYSRALSANEVANVYSAGALGKCLNPPPCANVIANPKSWWKGDGDGTDSVGTHSAVRKNGASFSSGKVGQSFDFDGVDDYAEISDSATWNPAGSFSIEGWILPEADHEGCILAKWGDEGDYYNNRSYVLQVAPGRTLSFSLTDYERQWDAPFVIMAVNNVITLNAWNHVAAVYDQSSGTRKLFVNGSRVAERTHAPVTVNSSIAKVIIGANLFSPTAVRAHFSGQIDELSFYTEALSDADVNAIYSAGASGKCLPYGPPAIVRQPSNTAVTSGETATFSVLATGALPLNYQWSYNGISILGATNAVLALSNVTDANAGTYVVRITNALGVAESEAAILSVSPVPTYAPSVTQPLQDRTVEEGDSLTFTVFATGTQPLKYQWHYEGTALTGETNASLTLPDVQRSQAGNYRVAITNDYGFAESSAMLTVNPRPSTVRALNVSVPAGDTVVVPVVLVANGQENALGFTLNFMPSKLFFQNVQMGPSVGSIIVNTNSAATGRVGVLVSTQFGTSFSPGTQEVALVRFSSSSSTLPSTTSVFFTDEPIARQVSDANGLTIPSFFSGGTVTLLPSEYEADISPRPSGDRQVSVTDWVMAGRFAAKLESTTNNSEFRRIDCAPRSTLGDGVIGLTDWVQAGRYAAKLDPINYAGGPEAPNRFAPAELPRKLSPSRQLRIADTFLAPVESRSLKVQLEAQGNENAVAFSISFDSAVLEYKEAALGNGVPAGTQLWLNSAEASSGRLAVLVAAQPGVVFSPGAAEVLKVSLLAKSPVSGSHTIALTDQPIRREVSDVLADSLPAEFVDGSVAIPPVPNMSIVAGVDSITLTWPAWATNYVLQTISDISGPNSAWLDVEATPQISAEKASVTLPVSGAASFYRLNRP